MLFGLPVRFGFDERWGIFKGEYRHRYSYETNYSKHECDMPRH